MIYSSQLNKINAHLFLSSIKIDFGVEKERILSPKEILPHGF